MSGSQNFTYYLGEEHALHSFKLGTYRRDTTLLPYSSCHPWVHVFPGWNRYVSAVLVHFLKLHLRHKKGELWLLFPPAKYSGRQRRNHRTSWSSKEKLGDEWSFRPTATLLLPKNVILDFHIHLTCLKCSKPGLDFRAILGILGRIHFGVLWDRICLCSEL